MSRNLACIFTPSDTLIPHYLGLLGAFTEGKDYKAPFADINAVTKDHLELYLKKLGPFSTFLHDFPLETEEAKGPKNEFTVRGPYVRAPPAHRARVPESASIPTKRAPSSRSPAEPASSSSSTSPCTSSA
jgi:hypothetical protein